MLAFFFASNKVLLGVKWDVGIEDWSWGYKDVLEHQKLEFHGEALKGEGHWSFELLDGYSNAETVHGF